MDEESNRIEQVSKSFSFKLAVAVSALFAVLGIYFYLIDGLAFLDLTTIALLLLFIGSVASIFFALKKTNIPMSAASILGAIIILVISSFKMGWLKEYYSNTEPFLFEAHIEKYPLWEEYIFSSLLGKPDWVGFAKDCGNPAIKGNPVPVDCTSYTAIQKKYNIDAKAALDEYVGRMRHTAGLINKRGTMNGPQYKKCILDKECAEIPLMPDNIDVNTVDPNDPRIIHITKSFWDLVENKPLTPEICTYSTLCRVLQSTGALRFEQ